MAGAADEGAVLWGEDERLTVIQTKRVRHPGAGEADNIGHLLPGAPQAAFGFKARCTDMRLMPSSLAMADGPRP